MEQRAAIAFLVTLCAFGCPPLLVPTGTSMCATSTSGSAGSPAPHATRGLPLGTASCGTLAPTGRGRTVWAEPESAAGAAWRGHGTARRPRWGECVSEGVGGRDGSLFSGPRSRGGEGGTAAAALTVERPPPPPREYHGPTNIFVACPALCLPPLRRGRASPPRAPCWEPPSSDAQASGALNGCTCGPCKRHFAAIGGILSVWQTTTAGGPAPLVASPACI